MSVTETNWFQLDAPETVASPGLIVDADRVESNIAQTVEMVGGKSHADRLRVHIKTHKMPDVTRLQMDAGITKFKVATLAEAEMVASVGPADLLLAYQPVGPNIERLATLVEQFPTCQFGAIVDDIEAASRIADRFSRSPSLRLWIDVDCGMHRTGIEFGDGLDRLRESIEALPGIQFGGLHVYDGHIHDPALETRSERARKIIAEVRKYVAGSPVPAIVGGGSPTFGIWATETDWQCSPGTPVFWDVGYGQDHPELPFLPAAGLLTRVISKPDNRLCLDLGYKSVSSEMPLDQRLVLPALPDAKLVSQSEEHLVVETAAAKEMRIGDALIAFPRHVCPSVALHAYATIVRDGVLTGERWPVTARDR